MCNVTAQDYQYLYIYVVIITIPPSSHSVLPPPFLARFIDHIAVMFSEVAPWDQERKYTPSTVEACSHNMTSYKST